MMRSPKPAGTINNVTTHGGHDNYELDHGEQFPRTRMDVEGGSSPSPSDRDGKAAKDHRHAQPTILLLSGLFELFHYILMMVLFIAPMMYNLLSGRFNSVYSATVRHLAFAYLPLSILLVIVMVVILMQQLSVRFMESPPRQHCLEVPIRLILLICIGAVSIIITNEAGSERGFIQTFFKDTMMRCSTLCGIGAFLYFLFLVVTEWIFSDRLRHPIAKLISWLYRRSRFAEYEKSNQVEEVYASVMKEFAEIPTSIVSDALLLVGEYHQYERSPAPSYDIETGYSTPSTLAATPDEMIYYQRAMKYASAVYGMLLLHNPVRWLVQLCCNPSSNAEKHRDAFLYMADIEPEQLIVGDFNGTICSPPYVAFADHNEKAVWVAISGTSTAQDVVTDMQAQCCSTELIPGALAHDGIWQSALNIAHRLRGSYELGAFLATHPDYSLNLTGHSLGGAIAASLHIILTSGAPLHDTHRDRHIRTMTFGAPPFLSSVFCKDPTLFPSLVNIIICDDIVTQMSLRRFKVVMAEASVLASALYNSGYHDNAPKRWKFGFEQSVHDFLRTFFDTLNMAEIKERVDERLQRSIHGTLDDDVGIPGRVVVLPSNRRQSIATANRVRKEKRRSIIVSRTMFWNHFPHVYQQKINTVVRTSVVSGP